MLCFKEKILDKDEVTIGTIIEAQGGGRFIIGDIDEDMVYLGGINTTSLCPLTKYEFMNVSSWTIISRIFEE